MDVSEDELEKSLKGVAVEVGTSIPDEIKYVGTLGTAYVIFPSVDAAYKVLHRLQGRLTIHTHLLTIDYTPTNLAKNNLHSNVNFVQDWYCDKV